MVDRCQLDKWLAEVDALLERTTMPQYLEKDPETGDLVLVDRPSPLEDNVINVPPTEDEDAKVVNEPRGDEVVEEDEEYYEDETKAQLQAELAERGLPTSGNKADLIARLAEADEK